MSNFPIHCLFVFIYMFGSVTWRDSGDIHSYICTYIAKAILPNIVKEIMFKNKMLYDKLILIF